MHNKELFKKNNSLNHRWQLVALSAFVLVSFVLFQNCSSSSNFSTKDTLVTISSLSEERDSQADMTEPSPGGDETQQEDTHDITTPSPPSSISPSRPLSKALFILSGQSNSWGLGKVSDLFTAPYESWSRYQTMDFRELNFSFFEAFQWRVDIFPYPVLNKLTKRHVSTASSFTGVESKFGFQHEWNNPSSAFDSEFGVEIGISGSLKSLKDIEIYKQAYPGYAISSFLDRYYESGTIKYNGSHMLFNLFTLLEANLVNRDKNNVFFIWHQGESDSTAQKSGDYDKNLERVLALTKEKMKILFPNATLWNFIVSIHSTEPTDQSSFPKAYWNQVRLKQQNVVLQGDGKTILLKTDHLPLGPDGIHINSEAQLALGECIGSLAESLSSENEPLELNRRLYQCKITKTNNQKNGTVSLATEI